MTGSAFADLAPYWCDRFDLESVVGFQASKRGGYTRAIQTLSSVRLLGQIAVYLRGELDASLARLHNRTGEEPEAPRRKTRRARKAKQLPAIFEDPMLPGLSERATAADIPPGAAIRGRWAAAAADRRDRRIAPPTLKLRLIRQLRCNASRIGAPASTGHPLPTADAHL